MKSLRTVAILTIIGVLSGALLAWVYAAANPLIEENRRRATKEAVIAVLPGTSKVKIMKAGKVRLFMGQDKNGRQTGLAFPAEPAGFQGKIKMMIGMDPKLKKTIGLAILENVETPGLGSRITEKSFQAQFAGLSGEREIILLKNQAPDKKKNQVEAITGATISSRAVTAGINKEIARVRKAWRQGGRHESL